MGVSVSKHTPNPHSTSRSTELTPKAHDVVLIKGSRTRATDTYHDLLVTRCP